MGLKRRVTIALFTGDRLGPDYELTYRSVTARNLVERFFNKIKRCRHIATRYDKLAANYLAFIKLASIRLSIRAYESAPWIWQ